MLILSPAVLDIVSRPGSQGEERPGGPALYAGAALSLLGDEPLALGPYGWDTLATVAAEKRLGVERIGYPVPARGTVYRLTLLPGGRRIAEQLSSSPPMGCGALAVARRLRPDAVIVSPVHADIAPCVLPLLRGYAHLVALDVQGFHRSGTVHALPQGAADIAHASDDEAPGLPGGVAGVLLVTSGPGPVRAVIRGVARTLLEEAPGGPLEDPTGAGDVFLALVVHAALRGDDPLDASAWAAGMVHRVLPRVQAMIRGQ